MNEIKCRAWHKIKKEWLEPPIIDGKNGLAMGFSLLDGSFQRHFPKDEVTIIQFTGLKDQNNQDIYNGDVIKRIRDSIVLGKKTKVEFYQKIVYVEKYAQYLLEDKNGVQEHASWASTGEVIGNIHEGVTLQ